MGNLGPKCIKNNVSICFFYRIIGLTRHLEGRSGQISMDVFPLGLPQSTVCCETSRLLTRLLGSAILLDRSFEEFGMNFGLTFCGSGGGFRGPE